MKVLHVIPSLAPEQGGLRTALWSTVAAQLCVGMDVEVACVGEAVASQAVPLHSFARSGFGPFATSREMRRWLLANAGRFDAIIAHSIWLSPTRYAALASRRHNVPFFIVPHGMLDPDALTHHALRKWLRWNTGEKRALKKSTLVFSTPEDGNRALSQPQVVGVNHVIIPNALDTSISPALRQLAAPPLILCLNRLHPRKGVLEFARALKRLSDEGIDFKAVLAGPEEDAEYVNRCRSEVGGFKDRVTFAGNLPWPEVQTLLTTAAVLVHPCVGFENFGMVIVEGIQAGVPVIASRRALVAPQLEHAQAVVGVEPEPTEIAEALNLVLTGTVPDNDIARRYVEREFSLKAVGQRWLQAISSTPQPSANPVSEPQ
ncbi:glycosyltransferase [Planctomycetota bacterium]|nr:glycosyltransferase [Planctomycetota bacterium]